MHHFVAKDWEASDHIWNNYMKESSRLMFQRIMHVARDNKDEELINRLVSVLQTSSLTAGAMGNAYSCLLDIQVGNEEFDKAYQQLKIVADKVGIANVNRTALLRLKEGLEKMNKPFEYEIPQKSRTKDGRSNNSSNEDELDVKM